MNARRGTVRLNLGAHAVAMDVARRVIAGWLTSTEGRNLPAPQREGARRAMTALWERERADLALLEKVRTAHAISIPEVA